MTTPHTDRPGRGAAGLPAHLWDLACSDVRMSVPERIRGAVANGANAPEGVRRIAARIAVVGASAGIPAALIGVGASADGDVSDAPVATAGGESPLDGLDPAPSVPGSDSYDSHDSHGGHGSYGADGSHTTYDVGPDGGSATHVTTGTGDVGAGTGTTWHVQEPGAEPGDWLTVQMFQDVTVTETADGMFVVDAYQYIVIRDDDGNEYVFKEHYQVIVPDPPGQETDLVIHERGFVHVIENPDGSFRVDSTDHGIDVVVTADGDGRDEVGITQTQGVRVTDDDHHDGIDVTVDLSEKATSTSDDTGDKATTTIKQGQVFSDEDLPPEPPWKESTGSSTSTSGRGEPAGHPGGHDGESPDPFGEEPADRQTTGAPGAGPSGAPVPTGSPGSPGSAAGGPASGAPASASSASGASAAGSSATGASAAAGSATAATAVPLSSTIAVATPVAATATWQAGPSGPEVRPVDHAVPVTPEHGTASAGEPAGAGQPPASSASSEPFGTGTPAAGHEPFGPPAEQPHPGTAEPAHPATGAGHPDEETANTGGAGHEPTVDTGPQDTPPEHPATEPTAEHPTGHTDDDTGGDAAHHGTGGDGADHALVS